MPTVQPGILVLLGRPGSGKYTVGRGVVAELAARGRTARLVDNHTMANVVFDLIAEADGSSVLPASIFDRVREINDAVIRTIEELSAPSWWFVFTHYLTDNAGNRAYLDRLARLAAQRGGSFLPVVLACDAGELERRLPAEDRRARKKLTDTGRLTALLQEPLLVPPEALTIDVTTSVPSAVASQIVDAALEGLRP